MLRIKHKIHKQCERLGRKIYIYSDNAKKIHEMNKENSIIIICDLNSLGSIPSPSCLSRCDYGLSLRSLYHL